jgi:phage-related protein (TIGR01555 family)
MQQACHAETMAKKQANAGQFPKGVSGNPRGRQRKDADETESRTDAIISAITGMGVIGRDKTSSECYSPDITSAEAGMLLWRGLALGAQIVEGPPSDALRQGFEIHIGDQRAPEPFTPVKPDPVAAVPPPNPKAKMQAKQDQHPSMYKRTYAARIDAARARRRRMDEGGEDADGKELQEHISKHWEDIGVKQVLKEAWCYGRACGGGAALIGANDYTTDLAKPLDMKNVRSLDYLTPLEGRELVPIYRYNNPRQDGGKFGKPAIFQLVPYNVGAPVPGTQQQNNVIMIHESRLVIFEGNRVTRRVQSGASSGWPDSVFTRCARSLLRYESAMQGASVLMSDFAQAVYKVKGLADLLTKNKNALVNKMVQVDMMRSIVRAMILDADGEDFERKATPMSGYPETLDRLATNLAADARQPQSKLFGQDPAGLNASGDTNVRWYYDDIAGMQQDILVPALMKLLRIELAIAGEDPDTVNHSLTFPPLWQPTGKEQAEERFIIAQTDQIYMMNDVYTPEETANSHFGGDQFNPDIHIDFDARAAMDAAVAPTVDAKPQPDPIIPDPNAPGVQGATGGGNANDEQPPK